LAALLLPSAAHAEGRPAAGCAEAFTLQSVDDFGAGFQTFLARVDKNGDRMVCTRLLPDALPFPPINFVDNVVRTQGN
jgi:hypothetical protein